MIFRLAFGLLFLYLSTLPLQWFRIANVGGLNLGYQHIFGIGMVLFLPFIFLRLPRNSEVKLYLLLCAGYILLGMMLTLFLSVPYHSFSWMVKQSVYFLISVSIIITLARVKHETYKKLAYLGPVAAAIFLLSFLYSAQIANVNLIALFVQAIKTGDSGLLMFQVFKATMVAGAGESVEELRSNLRHGIAEAILISSIISYSFARNFIEKRSHVFIINSANIVIMFVVMITLSRAVILSAIFCIAVLYFFVSFSDEAKKGKSPNFFGKYVLYFLLPCVTLILTFEFGLIDLIASRFFSSDQAGSYSGRLDVLNDTFKYIKEGVILPSSIRSFDPPVPHNIMLSAWLATGLLGLIVSSCFWLSIGLTMTNKILLAIKSRASYVPISYVGAVALLSLPFIRAVTAGGGLTASSWAALGLAYGVIARYELQKKYR